jgi:bifunctional UDP-N-acetylglucosamine pyrophosphorylase / glucosamine-1-phosphate N-acetyltransferase
MSELSAIVLAAGEGKRMKSKLTKVLHPIAGRPLVYYPVRAALDAGARSVAVVTNRDNAELVGAYVSTVFGKGRVRCVTQDPPRGTGDAARVGLTLTEADRVLILCGDTPLLRAEELARVLEALDASDKLELALMSCLVDDPGGYGRILRSPAGAVLEIREHRDLSNDEQRAVREVNAGVYAARRAPLAAALAELTPSNAANEYYLTDVVAMAAKRGAAAAVIGDAEALVGVNDRSQLAEAEILMYERIARQHCQNGVTVHRGARIEHGVTIEIDATIETDVFLRGQTAIGSGATIDVGCVVTDSKIGANTVLKPYSIVTGSVIGDWAQIGPFAHLRPGSQIDDKAHIGNFVECKKTRVRRGAKANHLSYLGDGDIGENANVGAGTIFCNYDGFQKHKTTIGAGAFVGSDSQFVAPVTVGKNAYVATATTVTKDVPEDGLAISRTKQENKEGYAKRLRGRLAAAAGKADPSRAPDTVKADPSRAPDTVKASDPTPDPDSGRSQKRA